MASQRPVVLIGMMLSGKSTVGRQLAARLNRRFVDVDDEIERFSGRSIPSWFESGEAAFREVEKEALKRCLADASFGVIATGGGVVLDEENRRLCRAHGFVVYLDATPEELAARAEGPSGRPLLDSAVSPRDALARILDRRQDLYRETKHLSVSAGRSRVDELVDAIIRAYDARTQN